MVVTELKSMKDQCHREYSACFSERASQRKEWKRNHGTKYPDIREDLGDHLFIEQIGRDLGCEFESRMKNTSR